MLQHCHCLNGRICIINLSRKKTCSVCFSLQFTKQFVVLCPSRATSSMNSWLKIARVKAYNIALYNNIIKYRAFEFKKKKKRKKKMKYFERTLPAIKSANTQEPYVGCWMFYFLISSMSISCLDKCHKLNVIKRIGINAPNCYEKDCKFLSVVILHHLRHILRHVSLGTFTTHGYNENRRSCQR